MSRTICVFPPCSSEFQSSDCDHHHHVSKKVAYEREQKGEIVRLDIPGTKFIESGPLGIDPERKYKNVPHPKITCETIERAFASSGAEARRARRKIEQFGARVLAIPHLTFDSVDVWIKTDRGAPVLAAIRRRDINVAARVERYLAMRWPGRSGKLRLSDVGKLNELLRQRRAELAAASRLLIDLWGGVLVQFWAGEFSAPLNHMRADRLPPAVVYFTLKAYLD